MNKDISAFNEKQNDINKEICDYLSFIIHLELKEATCKIWHAHPVWFLNENPIVGYSIQKKGVRLMFWSGSSFNEEKLNVLGKNFKDASIFYLTKEAINIDFLKRCLQKSKTIQWDYKNIIKRKGKLEILEL